MKTMGSEEVAAVGSISLATADDAEAIDEMMKVSIRDIFPLFYDERQTASSIIHVSSVDRRLIEDGTYFVIEEAVSSSPAVVGVAGTSCTRVRAKARAMAACSTRVSSRHAFGRCSSAPTERVVGSGHGSSRRAKPRLALKGSGRSR
jgi:hypothetical protein